MTIKQVNGIIELYCDGSSSKKYKHGAFAAHIIMNENINYSIAQPFTDVTNNQMELMGLIHPLIDILYKLKVNGLESSKVIIRVTSDSQYLVKGVNEWIYNWRRNGWKNASGKKLPNLELWKIIHYLLFELTNKSDFQYEVDMNWTKGHVSKELIEKSKDSFYNDLCDRLASSATDTIEEGVDYTIDTHINRIKQVIKTLEE